MTEGPKDLQSVWHKFIGNSFDNKTILDIGAGKGLSRERLKKNNNKVTLQDANRSLMNNIDLLVSVEKIIDKFDVVVSFDVIEHVIDPDEFLRNLYRITNKYIFFTTPNNYKYPSPWHYKPEELINIINKTEISNLQIRFYGRYKGEYFDFVREITKDNFLNDKKIHYIGIMLIKR